MNTDTREETVAPAAFSILVLSCHCSLCLCINVLLWVHSGPRQISVRNNEAIFCASYHYFHVRVVLQLRGLASYKSLFWFNDEQVPTILSTVEIFPISICSCETHNTLFARHRRRPKLTGGQNKPEENDTSTTTFISSITTKGLWTSSPLNFFELAGWDDCTNKSIHRMYKFYGTSMRLKIWSWTIVVDGECFFTQQETQTLLLTLLAPSWSWQTRKSKRINSK